MSTRPAPERHLAALVLLALALVTNTHGEEPTGERCRLRPGDLSRWEWARVNRDALWSPRAGLQVVEMDERFYLIGGRTPLPPPAPFGASQIHADVWISEDPPVEPNYDEIKKALGSF